MSESWCMAVGIPRIDMCLRVGAWLWVFLGLTCV